MIPAARPVLLSTAVVAVLLLSGCSGDGDDVTSDASAGAPTTSAPPAVPSSAAAATGAPTEAVSTAPTEAPDAAPDAAAPTLPSATQLATVAQAVNLRASDLPGYTSEAADDEPDSAEDKAASKRFGTCLGFPDFDSSDDGVSSPDFSKGTDIPQLQVSSEVSTDRPAVNVGSVRAFGSAKGLACFKAFATEGIASAFASEGVTASRVTVARLAAAPGRADAAAGATVTATLTAEGTSFPFRLDFVVIAQGGYAVTYTALGVQAQQPAAQRNALVATLSSRLVAATS